MSQVNENPIPVNVHLEPRFWGKPIAELIDLEIVQVYEFCLQGEAKREAAKKKLIERKIALPDINNQNYNNLKNTILDEMKKRGINV